MKIFVIGARGLPGIQGGVEKHCEELYSRLVGCGNQITVFARNHYFGFDKRKPSWNNIKIKYLPCPNKKNIETITHTFIACLITILKRPDIAHFHNIGPAIFLPLVKLFGIKTVLTYHSINYQHEKWGFFARVMLKAGEKLGVAFADKIIAVSNTTKELLEKKYVRTDICYIPNGIDTPCDILQKGILCHLKNPQACHPEQSEGSLFTNNEILHPKIRTQNDNGREFFSEPILGKYGLMKQKYIFSACRFTPEKGALDLIKAFLVIKNPLFKLVIAGSADHETGYSRTIIDESKNSPNIVLTGFISGAVLREMYSNAGLFVLASYNEGHPIALLEALSYGLPALVSNIPQNMEIGLPDFRYFKVGDINTLSIKMVELINTGISEVEKSEQISMLRNNYDWDKITKQTHELFKEIA